MKLRNKKTGEIRDFNAVIHELNMFGSLAELNEEWEDVGTFWFLNGCGDVCRDEDDKHKEEVLENTKQIGNYFNTKEEAEEAVEKLKAWKRLKDKGFRFTDWNVSLCELYFKAPESFYPNDDCITDETKRDLDLLFGGGE